MRDRIYPWACRDVLDSRCHVAGLKRIFAHWETMKIYWGVRWCVYISAEYRLYEVLCLFHIELLRRRSAAEELLASKAIVWPVLLLDPTSLARRFETNVVDPSIDHPQSYISSKLGLFFYGCVVTHHQSPGKGHHRSQVLLLILNKSDHHKSTIVNIQVCVKVLQESSPWLYDHLLAMIFWYFLYIVVIVDLDTGSFRRWYTYCEHWGFVSAWIDLQSFNGWVFGGIWGNNCRTNWYILIPIVSVFLVEV